MRWRYGSLSRPDAFASSAFRQSADYIFIRLRTGCPPLRSAWSYELHALVVEPSPVRGLAADCPLSRHLGFNRMPSHRFFLLSLPSRLPCFTATLWCNGLWGFPAIQREIIAARYRTAALVIYAHQDFLGMHGRSCRAHDIL